MEEQDFERLNIQKVTKLTPENVVIKEVEKEGRGFHILTECGIGMYVIM